jgi:AraC family transcriptional regulator
MLDSALEAEAVKFANRISREDLNKDEIVVTPAGVKSGWRWHGRSKIIVITLEPEKLQRFAQSEVGILLTGSQLKNLPQFTDADFCQAGAMPRDALISKDVGSEVLFEYLARVFLVILIQNYDHRPEEEMAFAQVVPASSRPLLFKYALFSKK